MSNEQAAFADELRTRIIQEPDVILEDADVMRALIAANDRAHGDNVVDLRGIAMDRLEGRLERLEDTHRSVISAAYENLAGMTQVHRAVLTFLEPTSFEDFIMTLGTDVADILRIPGVRLILESHETPDEGLAAIRNVLVVKEPGFIQEYVGRGRPLRQVTLRQSDRLTPMVFGRASPAILSEALIVLDFGPDRLPGLLAFGSDDPEHFSPNQGTDLLSFMGSAFERAMRRWLG